MDGIKINACFNIAADSKSGLEKEETQGREVKQYQEEISGNHLYHPGWYGYSEIDEQLNDMMKVIRVQFPKPISRASRDWCDDSPPSRPFVLPPIPLWSSASLAFLENDTPEAIDGGAAAL